MILSSDISNHFEQISKYTDELTEFFYSELQEPGGVEKVPRGYNGGQAADHECRAVPIGSRGPD